MQTRNACNVLLYFHVSRFLSLPQLELEEHSLQFLARVLWCLHLAEGPRRLCPVAFPTQDRTSTLKPKETVRAGYGAEKSAFGLSVGNGPSSLHPDSLPPADDPFRGGLCHRSALGHISVTCQILTASFPTGDRNKLQHQWLHLPPQREQSIVLKW